MTISVVILAGGEGRRIGGDKPLRLLCGKSLVTHVLERARRYSEHVNLSVAEPNQLADLGELRLVDEAPGIGPLAGFRAAFSHAVAENHERILIIPCDTPFLPTDLLDRLSAALTPSCEAAIAASGGRIHPSCGLWRTTMFSKLEAYLQVSRRSISGLVDSVNHATVEWPVTPFDPFFNVNGPEDMVLARALLRDMPSVH